VATLINELCCNCGACEFVCPGDGIHRDGASFVIDPARCTECVGFHAKQRCSFVCPIDDCCVPDPERVESEQVLFERALKQAAASDRKPPILSEKTSHFRVGTSRSWWERILPGQRNASAQPDNLESRGEELS
jgi:ferredoxin